MRCECTSPKRVSRDLWVRRWVGQSVKHRKEYKKRGDVCKGKGRFKETDYLSVGEKFRKEFTMDFHLLKSGVGWF